MSPQTIIVWFRQDLRLADNPALTAAHKAGAKILPVYILDDENAKKRKMGAASRVWLHHSLQSLNKDLKDNLVFLKSDAAVLLPELLKKSDADAVYWNRCYEPWRIQRDEKIKKSLGDKAKSFNGSLLWEPWDVLKSDGTSYKVFTPFYKACLQKDEPSAPMNAPKDMSFAKYDGVSLEKLDLLPSKPRWDKKIIEHREISEDGAHERLDDFLSHGLKDYKGGRDVMAKDYVSRMSPYLHFGQISPNQIWHAVKKHKTGANGESYLREIIWREFNYSLLYHFPKIVTDNFQPRFDDFPWDKNAKALYAWQKGQTGYPVVDAAMRELWETGWMHNRARLIVGSFLAKHLLLYWTEGEAWFWDCLFDADEANNICNWQWIAGTGADAAPYFRIFNPVTQGEKFDPDGAYVRRFVPELKDMPDKYIHHPWDAPPMILKAAGVELGKTYPKPIIDHAAARERALEAFSKTK